MSAKATDLLENLVSNEDCRQALKELLEKIFDAKVTIKVNEHSEIKTQPNNVYQEFLLKNLSEIINEIKKEDTPNPFEEAYDKVYNEGYDDGYDEGSYQRSLEIAKILTKENINIKTIESATDLTKEEIESL